MERQLIVLWYGRLVLANRSRVDLAHHLFDGRSAELPQPNGAAANDRECQRDGAQASQEQQRIDRGHPV
jgi:hypothetical protein